MEKNQGLGTVHEWGVAAPAATPPMTQTTKTAIGAVAGAVVGGGIGHLVKPGMVGVGAGAVAGGVAGGVAGHYYGAPAAALAAAPPCVTSPATLPQGGYTQVATTLQGGAQVKLLAPGGSYLLSIPVPAGTDATPTLTQLTTELTSLKITNAGAWTCAAPAGWPAGDPNAASGVFLSVFVPNNTPVSIPLPAIPGLTVWATNGNTA